MFDLKREKTSLQIMKLAKYFSIFSQILADERPNVIILIGDDFGAGDFRVNQAASKVPTPNIDRLANEGVNFKVNFDLQIRKKR